MRTSRSARGRIKSLPIADPGALSAVRLSRLPGCLRYGKRDRDGKLDRYPEPRRQRLVWLNPAAPAAPILDLVPR